MGPLGPMGPKGPLVGEIPAFPDLCCPCCVHFQDSDFRIFPQTGLGNLDFPGGGITLGELLPLTLKTLSKNPSRTSLVRGNRR